MVLPAEEERPEGGAGQWCVYFLESFPRNRNLREIFQALPLREPACEQTGYWFHTLHFPRNLSWEVM